MVGVNLIGSHFTAETEAVAEETQAAEAETQAAAAAAAPTAVPVSTGNDVSAIVEKAMQ